MITSVIYILTDDNERNTVAGKGKGEKDPAQGWKRQVPDGGGGDQSPNKVHKKDWKCTECGTKVFGTKDKCWKAECKGTRPPQE